MRMNSNKLIEKIIDETASKKYSWVPYKNNKLNFQNKYLDYSQHFMPDFSYIMQVKQGTFLLASFQAMLSGTSVAEEIALYFYKSNCIDDQERIEGNSSNLYALRKIIELSLDDIHPNLNDFSKPDENSSPSQALSDFFNN